jgi:hypothetical protein
MRISNYNLALFVLTVVTASTMQSILPGGGFNGCTRDHCYYCETDGKDSWCTRCGNGRTINKLEGKDRFCETELTVENCRAAPVDDPLNPDVCGDCKNGYFLESPTSCIKLELEGCDRPYKETADGPILCDGCEGKFLKDDKTGCVDETDEEFPENCLFGGLIKDTKCQTCDHGWFPSTSGMSCEEERVTGCAIYHPNEPQKCFTCHTEEGFYAVKGEIDGDNVYQTCRFSGMVYLFKSVLLISFVAVFATQL